MEKKEQENRRRKKVHSESKKEDESETKNKERMGEQTIIAELMDFCLLFHLIVKNVPHKGMHNLTD